MRTQRPFPNRKERGIMLVDCLVYIGLFFLVLTVAFFLFYSCWDGSLALRRNTDDITSALRVGELWRADVRQATGPLRLEGSNEGQLCHIPVKSGEVVYKVSENSLWRSHDKQASWTRILLKVKSSRMDSQRRQQVTAWRWEIELPTRKKSPQIHPIFTFEAVPTASAKP